MYSAPWAKFTMRVTPKMSDNPAATRNSVEALASPLRNWMTNEDMLLRRSELPHLCILRQEPGAVRVAPRGHHALAVFHGGPADVRAHRRLVVERAEGYRAERRVDPETLHRLDQLLAVEAPRLPDRRGGGHHRGVADDRSRPRVVVPALAVGVEEAPVLRRVDRVPGIARDPPAFGRLVLQRIEVLGLAAEEIQHLAALEQPARLALAHEAREVAGEERGEDRVGLRVGERLDHRSRVELAERSGLLGDELDVGLRALQEVLEGRSRRLAVFVVRVDDRPALLVQLRRLGDQHRGLHPGGGPQPEGVAVAVLPHDLVGERLGREEQHLPLFREVGDCEADVGRERAHEEGDLLAREQLLGDTHRVARVAVVVARDDLDPAAEDSARGVDLVLRELPTLAVRLEKRREHLVAVELADLDRLLGGGALRNRESGREYERPLIELHRLPSMRFSEYTMAPPWRLCASSSRSARSCMRERSFRRPTRPGPCASSSPSRRAARRTRHRAAWRRSSRACGASRWCSSTNPARAPPSPRRTSRRARRTATRSCSAARSRTPRRRISTATSATTR